MSDEKIEISVVVIGQGNSGKSRISYMIKDALLDYGFVVSVKDTDMSPEEFEEICPVNLEKVLSKLSEKVEIHIVQEQTNRKGFV